MTTTKGITAWWGVQTTIEKAHAAANGTHLIKHYDGRYVGTWRFKTPEFAQKAKADHEAFMAKFKKGYEDEGLKAPARPWRLEIV